MFVDRQVPDPFYIYEGTLPDTFLGIQVGDRVSLRHDSWDSEHEIPENFDVNIDVTEVVENEYVKGTVIDFGNQTCHERYGLTRGEEITFPQIKVISGHRY